MTGPQVACSTRMFVAATTVISRCCLCERVRRELADADLLQGHPNGVRGSRLLRGVLPEERVSLDSHRESQAPDRSASAGVDALLPWPVEVRAVEQFDDRCVVWDLSLAGQDSGGACEGHA